MASKEMSWWVAYSLECLVVEFGCNWPDRRRCGPNIIKKIISTMRKKLCQLFTDKEWHDIALQLSGKLSNSAIV